MLHFMRNICMPKVYMIVIIRSAKEEEENVRKQLIQNRKHKICNVVEFDFTHQ